MEYYSAIKNKENLPLRTTWVNLEGIMLREISQRERQTLPIWGHLYLKSKKESNSQNQRVDKCLSWDRRWGKQEDVGQWYKFSVTR